MVTELMKSQHPGSSAEEIHNEPDWVSTHHHRTGFLNHDQRRPGLTHEADDTEEDPTVQAEIEKRRKLRERERRGELVNYQDVMNNQPDLHLHDPGNYPLGWRFLVENTEDWIRNQQDWPANIKARQQKEEAEQKARQKREQEADDDEDQWRRQQEQGSTKHHDAYSAQVNDEEKDKTEYHRLREKYSVQEIALLRSCQNESSYIQNLQRNDGKIKSPAKQASLLRSLVIDNKDASTPDNWVSRSTHLMRQTGPHPLNGEPELDALFSAGLITPNYLHYTRNHGAVPRLFRETHTIDINDGALELSIPDLESRFEPVNIAVALACDGNRRGELNQRKKSKGFSWGPGAMSCAYWKGALLADVLSAAGVPDLRATEPGRERRWVNFEGSDSLSDGRYATCIPLEYAMDRCNDVLLAYEMNNLPLPPDHGYPVRILIPGYVGGRSVKWLRRVWISNYENDSHYHIWDNRVLPPFVTEKDGAFAETLFHHPSTACNEQNLNSVIVKPAHGEKLSVDDAYSKKLYRIEGLAYDGGGHEVQRVEVSLDDGETWLWCVRTFPDRPIRHGNKFWTWVRWHVDVDTSFLFRAKSISVRCYNVFKNTQPKEAEWNTMGMMNNGWYVVKPNLPSAEDGQDSDRKRCIVWKHPYDTKDGDGWVKPSVENQLAKAKQSGGVPDKEFTRQEVEKHSSQDDCWIVVNGNVYDATSVLKWHPGGASSIAAYAGQLSVETTDSFEMIHDDYAHQKLKECAIGRLTTKAANFLKKSAEEQAKKSVSSHQENVVLQTKAWTPVRLESRNKLSSDTYAYVFAYPKGCTVLGMETCQHIQIGIHMQDKMLVRSYTPTRPIVDSVNDPAPSNDHERSNKSPDGNTTERTFELTVKTYMPSDTQPGGAMSNFLLTMPIGEYVEVRGPTGSLVYKGNSVFEIAGEKKFRKVSLVLGGSGVTPGFSLIKRILDGKGSGEEHHDQTEIRVLDANKSEGDILLRDELNGFAKSYPSQFKITHVLSHPSEGWKGLTGHVDAEIIKKALFPPACGHKEQTGTESHQDPGDSVVLLCGPPGMIQKAALPALRDWGYVEDLNCFGF